MATWGAIDYMADPTISVDVSKISFVQAPRSSQFEVTGAVTISSAAAFLAPSMGFLFTNSIGQTFTIVNNDGVDPVTGTFGGLAWQPGRKERSFPSSIRSAVPSSPSATPVVRATTSC